MRYWLRISSRNRSRLFVTNWGITLVSTKHLDAHAALQHEIVLEVLGRVGKVIYGKISQYPSLTLYYVFKYLAMEHGLILELSGYTIKKRRACAALEGRLVAAHREALSKEYRKVLYTRSRWASQRWPRVAFQKRGE